MSLRRSTRLRTTKVVVEVPSEDPDDASDIDATEWTTTTSRKRRRTTARKQVKGKGAGAIIAEVPLDILREIFSYIDPCDLIAFSRVNKTFQAALVSKSNAFLWRDAAKSEGMPPCPSDINEYHYLKFAVDRACDFCGQLQPRSKALFRDWQQRKNVCKPCSVDEDIYDRDTYYGNPASAFYPRVMTKIGRRHRFRVHKGKMQALDAEYNSLTEDDTRKTWLAAKRVYMAEISKLRLPLDQWLDQKEEEREAMLNDLRESRYQAILAKLRDAGMTLELALMTEDQEYELKAIKGVSLPQPLDSQGWDKIKSPIFDFLEELKNARTEEFVQEAIQNLLPHFRDAFLEFIPDTSYHPYLPAWTDICLTANTGIISTPALFLDETVAKDYFSALLHADDGFRLAVSKWRTGIDQKILDLIKVANPSATLDDLSSLNNVFSCGRCNKLMHYTHIVVHRCQPMVEPFSVKTYGCNFTTWNSQPFSFEATLSQSVAAATQELGLTILTEDIMGFSLFDCSSCSDASGHRVLRCWNEMLTDWEACIGQGHKVARATLTPEEKKLKDLYIDLQFARSSDPILVCAACRAIMRGCADGSESFLEHKATCHGEEDHKVWREGVDFYRHPEVASSITFKNGFILREGIDIRDIIAGAWNNSSGKGKRIPDLRTYSCLDPETSKILQDLYN